MQLFEAGRDRAESVDFLTMKRTYKEDIYLLQERYYQ